MPVLHVDHQLADRAPRLCRVPSANDPTSAPPHCATRSVGPGTASFGNVVVPRPHNRLDWALCMFEHVGHVIAITVEQSANQKLGIVISFNGRTGSPERTITLMLQIQQRPGRQYRSAVPELFRRGCNRGRPSSLAAISMFNSNSSMWAMPSI